MFTNHDSKEVKLSSARLPILLDTVNSLITKITIPKNSQGSSQKTAEHFIKNCHEIVESKIEDPFNNHTFNKTFQDSVLYEESKNLYHAKPFVALNKEYKVNEYKAPTFTGDDESDDPTNIAVSAAHYLIHIRDWLIYMGRLSGKRYLDRFNLLNSIFKDDIPTEDTLIQNNAANEFMRFQITTLASPENDADVTSIRDWAKAVWTQICSTTDREARKFIDDFYLQNPPSKNAPENKTEDCISKTEMPSHYLNSECLAYAQIISNYFDKPLGNDGFYYTNLINALKFINDLGVDPDTKKNLTLKIEKRVPCTQQNLNELFVKTKEKHSEAFSTEVKSFTADTKGVNLTQVSKAIKRYQAKKEGFLGFFGFSYSFSSSDSIAMQRILTDFFAKQNPEFSTHMKDRIKKEALTIINNLNFLDNLLKQSLTKKINDRKILTNYERQCLVQAYIEQFPKRAFSKALQKEITVENRLQVSYAPR